MMSDSPYSRASASIGFPGSYGANPRTPGTANSTGSKDIDYRFSIAR